MRRANTEACNRRCEDSSSCFAKYRICDGAVVPRINFANIGLWRACLKPGRVGVEPANHIAHQVLYAAAKPSHAF